MFQVIKSLSTNIGLIPILIIGKIQDIIVKAGSIISSPFFKFNDSTANCKAAVPLLATIAYLRLRYLANFFQILLQIFQ